MDERWGKWLIIIGLGIVLIGLGMRYFGKYFGWIGNLPGDVRIEKENFKLYFPITSMVLLSIILNVLIKLVNYFR